MQFVLDFEGFQDLCKGMWPLKIVELDLYCVNIS